MILNLAYAGARARSGRDYYPVRSSVMKYKNALLASDIEFLREAIEHRKRALHIGEGAVPRVEDNELLTGREVRELARLMSGHSLYYLGSSDRVVTNEGGLRYYSNEREGWVWGPIERKRFGVKEACSWAARDITEVPGFPQNLPEIAARSGRRVPLLVGDVSAVYRACQYNNLVEVPEGGGYGKISPRVAEETFYGEGMTYRYTSPRSTGEGRVFDEPFLYAERTIGERDYTGTVKKYGNSAHGRNLDEIFYPTPLPIKGAYLYVVWILELTRRVSASANVRGSMEERVYARDYAAVKAVAYHVPIQTRGGVYSMDVYPSESFLSSFAAEADSKCALISTDLAPLAPDEYNLTLASNTTEIRGTPYLFYHFNDGYTVNYYKIF